jgi:hypothetical protein
MLKTSVRSITLRHVRTRFAHSARSFSSQSGTPSSPPTPPSPTPPSGEPHKNFVLQNAEHMLARVAETATAKDMKGS